MSTGPDSLVLGNCADCEAIIPSEQLLISYQSKDGWPRMYAECPECGEVVRPV